VAGKIYNFEETLGEPTLSVFEFIAGVNSTLGRHKGRIEGEVTSLKSTYPTAIYFSIKDTEHDALLNCVIWRSTYNQNSVDLKEGDKVIVTGTPEIYAARGSFSLKVQTIEYAGEGALKKSYDELKFKLTAEGLLAAGRKRPLPVYPKKIGVITSRSGVVIQDFNANLGRYGFQTTMVDSRVEGKDAIHEILAALRTMAKQDIEVLVIIRGGGSWESLQAFNTESVVRAIAGFKCPVLTGIGHDVDVTLAELVADVGASTPTGVAEVLNETWDTLTSSLGIAEGRIMNSYQRRLMATARHLESRSGWILRTYEQVLRVTTKRLAETTRSTQAFYREIEKTITIANTTFQLLVGTMKTQMRALSTHLERVETFLLKQLLVSIASTNRGLMSEASEVVTQQRRLLKNANQSLTNFEHQIKLSDPARTLKLGYSLSYVQGKVLRSVVDVVARQTVETRLADGSFISEVKQVL